MYLDKLDFALGPGTVYSLFSQMYLNKLNSALGPGTLHSIFSDMYLEELDPDLKFGPWTEEEDKCLLFLHKLFYQVIQA